MNSLPFISLKTLVAAGAVASTLGLGVVVASAQTTQNDFGQQVKAQVATCQATRAATGPRGIGHCVSAWVTTHNPGTLARTKAPEAAETPDTETNDSDTNDGKGMNQPTGHPTPHSGQGQAHGHSGH